MATASPMARAAVVLVVGARFMGQASSGTLMSRTISLCRASVERGLPVMSTMGTPMRLSGGRMASISSVSPELESATTTSPRATMPRSPCTPSAGCRKWAGVPVEASVAAIFRAMMPDLPMPVTITRPAQRCSSVDGPVERRVELADQSEDPLGLQPQHALGNPPGRGWPGAAGPGWLTGAAPGGWRGSRRGASADRRCAACWGRRTGVARRARCGRGPRASP